MMNESSYSNSKYNPNSEIDQYRLSNITIVIGIAMLMFKISKEMAPIAIRM